MKYTEFKTIKEQIKNNSIKIRFLTKGKSFYFDISTFIANAGIGLPPYEKYSSFSKANKAVYDCLIARHPDPKQQEILHQFKFIKDFGQLELFD
jgi:hypothetical protein